MFECIISTNLLSVHNAIRKYYFPGAKLFSGKICELLLTREFVLIIIEPFHINKIYFSIAKLWKDYLSIHTPHTKLIVMGFCNFQSRNYIDLLNLPKDFNAYLQNALPVSEDWEIPIDGADMLAYLKRFFAGHGGHSLIAKLNGLHQSINTAYYQLAQGEADFREITTTLLQPFAKPEFEALYRRWQQYYPYFEYLPFYPAMEEINRKFSEISGFFSCTPPNKVLFLKLDIHASLFRLQRQLTEIDRLYIRPEIYRP